MNDLRMIIQSHKAMNWSCRHIYGPGLRKHEALLCCLLQRRKPRLNVGEYFLFVFGANGIDRCFHPHQLLGGQILKQVALQQVGVFLGAPTRDAAVLGRLPFATEYLVKEGLVAFQVVFEGVEPMLIGQWQSRAHVLAVLVGGQVLVDIQIDIRIFSLGFLGGSQRAFVDPFLFDWRSSGSGGASRACLRDVGCAVRGLGGRRGAMFLLVLL
jgi:hypothetical protein